MEWDSGFEGWVWVYRFGSSVLFWCVVVVMMFMRLGWVVSCFSVCGLVWWISMLVLKDCMLVGSGEKLLDLCISLLRKRCRGLFMVIFNSFG